MKPSYRGSSPRILIGCYEPPGYGGAATSAYQLLHHLVRDGVDVDYVSFVEERMAGYFEKQLGPGYLNPMHNDRAHAFLLREPIYLDHPELPSFIKALAPDVLVGIGYIGAYILHKACPELPLQFVTTGCEQAKRWLLRGWAKDAQDLLTKISSNQPVPILHDIEAKVFAASQTIIVHSGLMQQLSAQFFPQHKDKLHKKVVSFVEWIYGPAKEWLTEQIEFEDRDIDLIFAASNWIREEKNADLMIEICEYMGQDTNIHIVGNLREPVPNATCHGLVEPTDVYRLIARSKVLVCPSKFDAAPGILFEGAALGCNLVASRNCGNWEICHKNLIPASLNARSFGDTIKLALSKRYPDNTRRLLDQRNYLGLLDVIIGSGSSKGGKVAIS